MQKQGMPKELQRCRDDLQQQGSAQHMSAEVSLPRDTGDRRMA